ncbi:MAG: DUF3656 domain-containing protein, partial [Lachnospiraceae bacterium]|nr:DUF3656 domain-containing protein [Lachnospiraceae bacterium]
YRFSDRDGKVLSNRDEPYLLSLKDLNTIDVLPELIRTGVSSLKIEGRMKKASYASGVTSIYRKYLDLALSGEPYRVEEPDRKLLFDLFNRQGFTDGYMKKKNGADMIASSEKEFRAPDESELERITRSYAEGIFEIPVRASYTIREGAPMRIRMTAERDGAVVISESESSFVPERASNAPASKEDVERQLLKTGGSGFSFRELQGSLEGQPFLPVSALNAFRRKALSDLKEAILKPYRRTAV